MRAADVLAKFLVKAGIRNVYVLSGGMIAPLIDAIAQTGDLRLVLVSHEQAGAFAAEAEARVTGLPAVALGTSGPGALNLISGIASCHYESIPALFVGGQVQTYFQRRDRPTRQFGLQESPFAQIVDPIAKATFTITRAADLPLVLTEALSIATTGRPGPVAIEFPFDLQLADITVAEIPFPPNPSRPQPDGAAVDAAATLLRGAERPLVLAGGGVRGSDARNILSKFCCHFNLPLATTLAAMDVMPADNRLRIGMPGMYGTRLANTILSRADVILVLGSRLDHGVLGADPSGFARRHTIVRVDCDPGEMSCRLRPHLPVVADVFSFLEQLEAALARAGFRAPDGWRAEISRTASCFSDTAERPLGRDIDPNRFFDRLGRLSGEAKAFVVDAGQHTFFCAQSIKLAQGQRYVSSIGLGSMGTAIPGAIGVALATGGPVVAVSGDGAIQLNIQDLHTVNQHGLPIKFVVMNNRSHGLVRQFQKEVLDGRYYATLWKYDVPDLLSIFAAYGIEGRSIASESEIDAALAWLWHDPGRPQLLEFAADPMVDISPMVPLGRQIHQMVPQMASTGRIIGGMEQAKEGLDVE